MELGPIGNPGEPVQKLVGLEYRPVYVHVQTLLQQMGEITVMEATMNFRLVTLVLAQVLLKCVILS